MLAFVVCAGVGYFGASAFVAPTGAPVSAERTSRPIEALGPMPEGQSAFLVEWEKFRGAAPASSEELSQRFLATKEVTDEFRRRAFRAALLGEWATTDPQAALVFLKEKDSGQLSALAREWLRRDPNAAVNALLAAGDKGKGALRDVLNEIAMLAPTRLAEVVSALPKPGRGDTTAQDALERLAVKDLEVARHVAEAITGPWRGQALAGVTKAWAAKDSAAALGWAQALPAGAERDAALKAGLIGWATIDPLAALDRIDLAPPGGDGQTFYGGDTGGEVLRLAGKRDWDGTLRWLVAHPGKLGAESLDGLLPTLSEQIERDAAATLRVLSQRELHGMQRVLANSLLNEGYAARDGIWAWLDQQPPSDFTRSVRGSLLNSIGYHEPLAALEFLDRIPDTKENHQVLMQGAISLTSSGPMNDRLETLAAKASPKVRAYLFESALASGYGLLTNQPALWVSRIEALPEDRRLDAMSGLARSWSSSDPQAALKWAANLTKPEQREQVFGAAVDNWIQEDVYEASRWIDGLPTGANRDRAALGLVANLSESQPDAAWDWALSIGSSKNRSEALQMAYVGLLKKDAAAVGQRLQRANLTAAELDTLRKMQKP
jgi:hypothetical protein